MGNIYAGTMESREQLSYDFKLFVKRLLYRYPGCEYIAVPELQERGTWHMHVLLKNFAVRRLDIPVIMLQKFWPHGHVWVTRIRGNNNIGAYFVYKYRPNNDRQPLYPKGCKYYHCSRGIKRPIETKTTYGSVKNDLGSMRLLRANHYEITKDDTVLNRVSKLQYRKAGEK